MKKLNLIMILVFIFKNAWAAEIYTLHSSQNIVEDHSVIRDSISKQNYKKSFYLDLGKGWSPRSRSLTANLNMELSKRILISLSLDKAFAPIETYDLPYFGNIFNSPPEYKEGFDVKSIGIKIGKVFKNQWCLITYSFGISSFKATKYSNTGHFIQSGYFLGLLPRYVTVWEIAEFSGVGIFADAKIIPSIKSIGLSIVPFVNINAIHSYGGLTIGLAFGEVHFKK